MQKILLFDNYDSFTYNLLHAIRKLGFTDVEVRRNDRITLGEIDRFDKIVLSPGPGIPSEAGILLPLIERYGDSKSILGVCLGHQAIGESYGAKLSNLSEVCHGISTPIRITGESLLFDGLESGFEAARYHSWVVSPDQFPDCLQVTATDNQGMIMALQHRKHRVYGIQFHPESVLTPQGETILLNWLQKG